MIYSSEDFQYIPHRLDLSIKIPVEQTNWFLGNYVSIQNENDPRPTYYFVIDYEWKGQNTLQLNLSVDSLNTMRNYLQFMPSTYIYRMHRNRFSSYDSTTGKLYANIDEVDEGLSGVPLFYSSTSPKTWIYDSAASTTAEREANWYLVYKNAEEQTENNVVDCYLIPETAQSYTQPAEPITIENLINTSNDGVFVLGNNTFRIYGIDYSSTNTNKYIIYRTANTAGLYRYKTTDGSLTPIDEDLLLQTQVTFLGTTTLSVPFAFIGDDTFSDFSSDSMRRVVYPSLITSTFNVTSTTTTSYTLNTLSEVDRTLPSLIKIIECPYPPVDIQTSINNGDLTIVFTQDLSTQSMRVLKLSNLSANFTKNIATTDLTDYYVLDAPSAVFAPTYTANRYYEPKMHHSSIYNYKIGYDSFSTIIPLERIKGQPANLNINYTQSNTINSNFFLKWTLGTSSRPGIATTFENAEDFENILNCNRNNEYPIYNSSYLDYLRNGYRYDVKSKWQQVRQGVYSLAGQIVGIGAGIAASAATGGISTVASISAGVGVISSLAGIFENAAAADRAIAQTKEQAKNQANSILASDDLNLLNQYGKNKAFVAKYEPTQHMQDTLFDLFHYTGYAFNRQEVPNVTSRRWFNFLQCDAVLSTEGVGFMVPYLADIKARFKAGVTFFHHYNNTWDLRQIYENWETNLE